MKFGAACEQNRQSEPPTRKPMEDSFCIQLRDDRLVATVMDGIPVLRDRQNLYPKNNGSIAAIIAAQDICFFLKDPEINSEDLFHAFRHANESIHRANSEHGIYMQKQPNWLATVGCALWVEPKKRRGYFGYIGDPFAFCISPEVRVVTLLTHDQLAPFENHLNTVHAREFNDPGATAWIREHQDAHVRNCRDAKCFCGTPLEGWGALTGEENAMDFVRVTATSAEPGTRYILASDAIEAIGAGNGKERRAVDYQDVFESIRGLSPTDAAQELLNLTRKGCKSDDATFLVVDL